MKLWKFIPFLIFLTIFSQSYAFLEVNALNKINFESCTSHENISSQLQIIGNGGPTGSTQWTQVPTGFSLTSPTSPPSLSAAFSYETKVINPNSAASATVQVFLNTQPIACLSVAINFPQFSSNPQNGIVTAKLPSLKPGDIISIQVSKACNISFDFFLFMIEP